jgi:DNA-binding transcriptional ArsR family regulator
MSDDEVPATTLSPDEAFEVLGNETRVAILRSLGEADEPLSFSALREAVGVEDSGQFNYHLDRLVGHFVRRTDDGYDLRGAGARVVEAVLSGAVTEAPVLDRTETDAACHFCGAPVAVTFGEERVELYCTECSGLYASSSSPGATSEDAGDGYLGYHPLPPAGLRGRDADTVLRAAWAWGQLELFAAASGICPRCSAPVDRDRRVCADHDDGEELCETCGRRYAVALDFECTNCIYRAGGAAVVGLANATPLLAFLTDRDLNPVAPGPEDFSTVMGTFHDYEEHVRSTDPFEAVFTFWVGDDAVALTVDDDMRVVAVEERRRS